jgi:hypothetical protein
MAPVALDFAGQPLRLPGQAGAPALRAPGRLPYSLPRLQAGAWERGETKGEMSKPSQRLLKANRRALSVTLQPLLLLL